jgi:hypothetical protein
MVWSYPLPAEATIGDPVRRYRRDSVLAVADPPGRDNPRCGRYVAVVMWGRYSLGKTQSERWGEAAKA